MFHLNISGCESGIHQQDVPTVEELGLCHQVVGDLHKPCGESRCGNPSETNEAKSFHYDCAAAGDAKDF